MDEMIEISVTNTSAPPVMIIKDHQVHFSNLRLIKSLCRVRLVTLNLHSLIFAQFAGSKHNVSVYNKRRS